MPRYLTPVLSFVLVFAMALPAAAFDRVYTFDNPDDPLMDHWFSDNTHELEEHKVKGLMNSRSDKWNNWARLSLEGLEKKPVTLTFDLFYVGRWESGGDLADWFNVEANDEEVLRVTEFPCKLVGGDESQPVDHDGTVLLRGRRTLGFWIETHTVTIPAKLVDDGDLELRFFAELSGRKTEYFALDNVRIQQ